MIRDGEYIEEIYAGTREDALKRKDFLQDRDFAEWRVNIETNELSYYDAIEEYCKRHVWTVDKYKVMTRSK